MSCYRPLVAIRTGIFNDETGKYKYIFTGHSWTPADKSDPDHVMIPCGHCVGCRLDYSRQWANRMMCELDHCKGHAIFATLTYDEDHVTLGGQHYTLVKKDVQDFMKRFRSRKKFEDREIRFYLSGEYGDHTFRPHYHAIIFGVGLEDFEDLQPFRINELKQQTYISEEFADIWDNGYIVLADVSWETMAYVSRYVQKKAFGNNQIAYEYLGIEPEFSLMSRKPGIGNLFFQDHPELMENDFFYLNDGSKRVKLPITRNLMKVLEVDCPERYNELKTRHKLYSDDKILSEVLSQDLSFGDYLALKEQKHLDKIHNLRRNKV